MPKPHWTTFIPCPPVYTNAWKHVYDAFSDIIMIVFVICRLWMLCLLSRLMMFWSLCVGSSIRRFGCYMGSIIRNMSFRSFGFALRVVRLSMMRFILGIWMKLWYVGHVLWWPCRICCYLRRFCYSGPGLTFFSGFLFNFRSACIGNNQLQRNVVLGLGSCLPRFSSN